MTCHSYSPCAVRTDFCLTRAWAFGQARHQKPGWAGPKTARLGNRIRHSIRERMGHGLQRGAGRTPNEFATAMRAAEARGRLRFAGCAVLSRKPGGGKCRMITCAKSGGRSIWSGSVSEGKKAAVLNQVFSMQHGEVPVLPCNLKFTIPDNPKQ